MHHVLVGYIGIGKDDLFDAQFLDQARQLVFGVNRDTLGVELTGQFFGVEAAFDIGDLGGGESQDVVILIPSEKGIEVVEIAPGGAHDQGTDRGHAGSPPVSGVSC